MPGASRGTDGSNPVPSSGEFSRAQRIDPNRLCDVLDALLAHILEGVGEPIADMVADRTRNADAARRSQPLQPRDVDAVPRWVKR